MCFSASAVVPKISDFHAPKATMGDIFPLDHLFGYFSPLLRYIAGVVSWPREGIVVQELCKSRWLWMVKDNTPKVRLHFACENPSHV